MNDFNPPTEVLDQPVAPEPTRNILQESMRTRYRLLVCLAAYFAIGFLDVFETGNDEVGKGIIGIFVGAIAMCIFAALFGLISKIHHRVFRFLEILEFCFIYSAVTMILAKLLWPFYLLLADWIVPLTAIYITVLAFLFWVPLWRIVLHGPKTLIPNLLGAVFTIGLTALTVVIGKVWFHNTDNYRSYLPTGLPYALFSREQPMEKVFESFKVVSDKAYAEVESHRVVKVDEPNIGDKHPKLFAVTELEDKSNGLWEHSDFLLHVPTLNESSRGVLIVFNSGLSVEDAVKFWGPLGDQTNKLVLISKTVKDGMELRPAFQLLLSSFGELGKKFNADFSKVVVAGFGGSGMAAHMFAYYNPEKIQSVIVNAGYINEKLSNLAFGSDEIPRHAALIVSQADGDKLQKMKADKLTLENANWATEWIEYDGGHVLAPAASFLKALQWIDSKGKSPDVAQKPQPALQ